MPLLTASPDPQLIYDQARELRRLIAKRSTSDSAATGTSARNCRSLAVFSGKGGVGKSVVALNLAIALAQRGAAVCLLDATPHVGNIGLLCGQNGYWNLSHVAAGTRSLDDIILPGPCGIRIIPGGFHLLQKSVTHDALYRGLSELERHYDWLIVDTSTDVLHYARRLVEAADCALCIATPEPTAVAEAYAGLKTLSVERGSNISILINQADNEQQAHEILQRLRQAARSFLGSDTTLAGHVPFDDAIRQSVFHRKPLVAVNPRCPAQISLEQIAERFTRTVTRRCDQGYFEQLEISQSGQ